ncbi:hypothetical protein [uncultured Albimonas sp.]|uniref:hypothetical protein n=1 Tax=uncultured Albimonas sp. TaxID=1331701 RepID=UPI0030EB3B43|tara:strand:+ start:5064 stop:5675 length:612 start_codon:yes stop_codon:yes gene_type:complete
MALRLSPLVLAAALALPAASASAFSTVVTPLETGLEYAYLQINWQTGKTSGLVDVADLSFLEFEIFGLDGLLQFTDLAIEDGLVAPLGNNARDLSDLAFSFELGLPPEDRGLALKSFDNNLGDVSLILGGDTFTMLDVAGLLNPATGLIAVSTSTWAPAGAPPSPTLQYQRLDVASVVATPLPGALALLAAGLGALGLVRRRG